MAIVKTLIVKGVARFLTDAYMSTIRSGIWNGSTIQVGYGGTGVTSAKGDLYTPVFLSSSGITACSVAIPHNTKDFKINGTTYSIFTTYTGTAPTIFAPTSLAGTGGYILATNSAKTGLEWVAKPATNVTTSAVLADAANSTTQLSESSESESKANPYYNLIEGGSITRSVQFVAGEGMTVGTTDGSDIKITNVAPIYYIKGNADTTAGTWTGTDTRISAYYEGLTIVFVPLVAGASTTTLNINGLGAKTCYVTNASKLTTHFAVGTPIMFTYYGGYWKRADYDSNSNTWRDIYTSGTSRVGTGTGTKAMNFAVAGNLSVSYLAAGTDSGQSGSANYFTVKITANANAVGVAGYVAAPTAADNKHNVWMTNSDGVPAWRSVTVPTTVPTLAWNTETSIGTVGGITFKVKLPTNPNSDTKVTQNSDTTNSNYRLLFKYSGNNTNETNTVKYATTLTYNPSTKLLYNNGPINVGDGSFADTVSIFGPVSSSTLKLSAYGLSSSWTNSSSNATRDFLKAWCKYIETNHAGKVILSGINPNSSGYIQAHDYGSGFVTLANIDSGGNYVNSELGAPVHINGHYYDHGGTEHIFGYSYGHWYMYSNLHSGNSSVSGGNTITNNVATPKPGDTLTVKINNVTKSLTIPTINSQATELAKVTKTLKVDTWTDMKAINSETAGTYAIQISSGNVIASGIFTMCGGTDSVIDEIPLHVSDKSTANTWRPYARISSNNLQMTTNEASGTSREYTIKILKLI